MPPLLLFERTEVHPMPVPIYTRTIRIAGSEITAEATLNNCSDAWTATARDGARLSASGAGASAEGALESAIERARKALERRPA